ncbi:MAG: hypothetical protein D6693_01470 [Planctomycetota bacterium]|nr:MAG: hypothetical protein D6693_01470 [Planctomycetota bacterium]
MMGRDGGVVFLLVYLVFALTIGAPMLIAEWSLGRATRRGPVGALARAGLPAGGFWGWALIVSIVMSASYYGVVVAWVLQTAIETARASIAGAPAPDHARLTASLPMQYALLLVTVGLGCGALGLGVRRGIERLSSAVVPVFFLLLIALIARALTLPGAGRGLREFLSPRWGEFGGRDALSALGQVVFSLGLGGTFMVAYGSYMRRETRLGRTAIGTTLADVSAALLAALLIVPAAASVGAPLSSGPPLMFDVLPAVFAGMPAGGALGTVFFLGVFLIAMLSLMAAYETIVAALRDALGWRRGWSLLLLGAVQSALALPAYLVPRYVEVSDFVWGTTMQPVGAALAVIALTWCLLRGGTLEARRLAGEVSLPRWLCLWLRYAVPCAIVATLAAGWWDGLSVITSLLRPAE